MRVGQKNKLTYRSARKGSRPRATHDQRTQSTYVFGAVCPARGTGAARVLPACNSEAVQLHLDEIATKVPPGRHGVSLLSGGSRRLDTCLDTPPSIKLRHADSGTAPIYTMQRLTIRPKTGSANRDATGSQWGSNTGSGKTDLMTGKRSLFR
jgi:hypothetical protein